MKKRMTALLTALLLALALCVPAMAAAEYGAIYDETEELGSVELTYQGEQTLPQLTEALGIDLRVDVFTDEGVEAIRTTEDGAEEPVKIACDYVVMAVGSKANAFDLDGVTVPVTCVGDCSGERTADIASAIRTAYHAANEL